MRNDAWLWHACTIKMEKGSENGGGGGCKRHQSSQCPLWSGVPVLFLTSTKPSLLGSNQSVTVWQAGGTKWCVCLWENEREREREREREIVMLELDYRTYSVGEVWVITADSTQVCYILLKKPTANGRLNNIMLKVGAINKTKPIKEWYCK